MSDVCRACKAPLIWAITKDGKRAPITREPKPDGNVLVFRTVTPGPVQARVFAGLALDELREQGVPLRLNHFADCPNREDFQ
jgi:hypothetical protein